MLNIHGLNKTYSNGHKALDNVALNIPKGMFGLLGPNGAGKSSLMRTIATLQHADSGSIIFDNIDIFAQPQILRARLGYLPQDFGVYPRVSALKLLNHLAILKGLDNRAERKEVVDGLLAKTNLYQHRKQAVSGYSGGMRQRFGIAQALLGDPDLLIVDEPTAGLDPEERNRFHNLLVSLGEQKAIILSTHIVEDVNDLCTNMAILAQGKVVLTGHPTELTHSLEGKIWRRVVSTGELEDVEANYRVISKRFSGGKNIVHVYSNDPIEGFTCHDGDLEDLYFSTLTAQQ
jgi:ABC-type multidrug transport system ATPase subunit